MSADEAALLICAGRALLGWSRDRLAAMVEVTPGSVVRLEQGNPTVSLATVAAIQAALEAAGVTFVSEAVGEPRAKLMRSADLA
ncbi:helix-turn-helix domain-containing protein [Acidisoma sp. 7E03]